MLAIATAQAACFYTRYYTPLLPPARPPTYPFILFLSLTLLVACLTLATVGGYRLPRRFHLNTISATLLRTMTGHIVIVTLAAYLLRLGMQFTKRPFLYSRPVVVTGWILQGQRERKQDGQGSPHGSQLSIGGTPRYSSGASTMGS